MAVNTNQYVIDASFILGALLPDEQHKEVDEVIQKYLNKSIFLIAPALFPFEVANAIRMGIVRKRITEKSAKVILKKLLELEISTEIINLEKVFSLANKHNLTVYDASYLALAKEKKAKLLTTDKKLQSLL